MSSGSVGAAMRASFGFLDVAWNRAWGVMLLLVSLGMAVQAATRSRPDMWPVTVSADAVLFVLATTAIGACYRIGLGPDHEGDPAFQIGPAGFNWGGLEWRVMVANIVAGLTIGLLAVFAIFVWAVVFGVSAATQGGIDSRGLASAPGSAEQLQAFLHIMEGPAGIVSALVAIPLLVGMAFLGAKLALFPVTAADTRGFNFGHAWSLTRGALAALILTSMAIFAVEIVAGMLAGFLAGLLAALFKQGVAGGRLWGSLAGQAVGAGLNTPLFAGLQIYVYRAQRGDSGVAQTFA
jgi:hypothetical protein